MQGPFFVEVFVFLWNFINNNLSPCYCETL